jgi:hypothetical protein
VVPPQYVNVDLPASVVITEGILPEGAQGRHCANCGEDIEAHLPRLPVTLGPVIAEWRHLDGYVHCPFSRENERPRALSPCTAAPCLTENCLSNSEHGAQSR